MPMGKQSLDFICGVLHESMMKAVCQTNSTFEHIGASCLIPKVWFGLPCSKSEDVTLDDCTQRHFNCKLVKMSEELFSNKRVTWYFRPFKQYIEVKYDIEKSPKKMTVAEIEKELGYRIEIVSE